MLSGLEWLLKQLLQQRSVPRPKTVRYPWTRINASLFDVVECHVVQLAMYTNARRECRVARYGKKRGRKKGEDNYYWGVRGDGFRFVE